MANTVIFQLSKLKFLDYATREILANVQVMGSLSLGFTGELAEQMTGPSPFTIETEVNRITTEGTVNIGEYGPEVLKVLMDAQNTVNAITSTTGLIKEQVNVKGNLVKSDGKAIASLDITGDATTIKSGLYRLSVSDKTNKTVQLHSLASPDLRKADFADQEKSLVKSGNIGDGAALDLGIGVSATGAATADFSDVSDGDFTIFRLIAPGAESNSTILGQDGIQIPKVKLVALARTMSDGRWFEIFVHNCIFPGVNFNFAEEFSANEITGKMIYDVTEQSVARITSYQKA